MAEIKKNGKVQVDEKTSAGAGKTAAGAGEAASGTATSSAAASGASAAAAGASAAAALERAASDARRAAISLAATPGTVKDSALRAVAEALEREKERIFRANHEDLSRSEAEGVAKPLLKRLKFDEAKLCDVVDGIKMLAGMEDPSGKILFETELDDGLVLYKKSCPIGVIGIIFESRPDALVQISTLCLKSGNAALLKGGREAARTNSELFAIITEAAGKAGIAPGWAVLLETREDVKEMLSLDRYIDLIIPRGSNEFVRYIQNNTNIPVMGHSDGICHCYADESADTEMAVRVIIDSKTQYTAVCNAAETLLVHMGAAAVLLPALKAEFDKRGVEIRGCRRTLEFINVKKATEEDWSTEYLDSIISVKIVESTEEAVDHINRYGSGHTDAIITESDENARYFEGHVDSANVFRNCSTRFSDGYRYGFGAEVGISTSKIHARGPVGIEGLMIYKYVLEGRGHIVEDYARKARTFKHIRRR